VAAVLRRPGEGETISDRAERNVRILLDHELADVTWTRYEPGERGPDPHIHEQHADAWYVLEGELVFGVGPGGETLHRAPAGVFLLDLDGAPPSGALLSRLSRPEQRRAEALATPLLRNRFAARRWGLRVALAGADDFRKPADDHR